MFKLYFLLFWEFAKIGVFAIGGGYAAIPFLFYLQSQYNWFSLEELTNMIAVSNITPGPVGINMATYTGYKTAGLFGALTATISIVLIPFIFAVIIAGFFTKFRENKNISYVFIGLRASACALLSYIAVKLFVQNISFQSIQNYDRQSLILFLILVIPFSFVKKNPLLTICFGAIGGLFLCKIL